MKKVAIITGGSKGIGFSIAKNLVDELNVVIVSKTENELNTAKEYLGNNCFSIKANITNIDEVELIVQKTLDKFGTIDVLVNNAGVYYEKPFLDHSISEINQVVSVDLIGMFYLTKKIIPIFQEKQRGDIINISSNVAFNGAKNQSIHSACKAAIKAFSESILKEYSSSNINVTSVHPNSTNTWNDPHPEQHLDPDDVGYYISLLIKNRPLRFGIPMIEMKVLK
jgi:short-subunit dehydrogenase